MQNPSDTSISENGTPVEPKAPPPAAEFPLKDHQCDRQGVKNVYGEEWATAGFQDIPYLMVLNAIERLGYPLNRIWHHIGDEITQILADANLPPELRSRFHRHWRWFIDLRGSQDQLASNVAALVATNLPTKFTNLESTLQTALANAGICCEEAANALIADTVGESDMAALVRDINGFDKDWLTISGAVELGTARREAIRQSIQAPAKPLESDTSESNQVSVLLTLKLVQPRDTSRWPAHMVIQDGAAAGMCWGFLDAMIDTGHISQGEGSHVLALDYREEEAPDWLPKAAVAGPWCSRVLTPLLKYSLEGKDSEGQQLWALGGPAAKTDTDPEEPPRPKPPKVLSPDSAQVTLRGKPMAKPTVVPIYQSTWYDQSTGIDHAPFYEAGFTLGAAEMEIRVYKNHHEESVLQRECDAIWKARDVQVSGLMMSGSKDDDYDLMVLVDQWFPITEEANAAP